MSKWASGIREAENQLPAGEGFSHGNSISCRFLLSGVWVSWAWTLCGFPKSKISSKFLIPSWELMSLPSVPFPAPKSLLCWFTSFSNLSPSPGNWSSLKTHPKKSRDGEWERWDGAGMLWAHQGHNSEILGFLSHCQDGGFAAWHRIAWFCN